MSTPRRDELEAMIRQLRPTERPDYRGIDDPEWSREGRGSSSALGTALLCLLAAVIAGVFLALLLIGAETVVCALDSGFSYCEQP